MRDPHNPFAVTRAVDLTDPEITRHWVDLPGAGGTVEFARPLSRMPILVLGGKGSGKTHLMRYLADGSRLDPRSVQGLCRLGYVGVYLRAGGINSARFYGKGLSQELWDAVFQYYLDLTLAELCLGTIRAAVVGSGVDATIEVNLCRQIGQLFDDVPSPWPSTIAEIISLISDLRRKLDLEVNNCAITRSLNVKIAASPSRLVFGIPQAAAETIDGLQSVVFVYYIDELENLGERQQIYVNSLVRDNEPPCSFRIGARLYGLKTLRTLSSNEELKEGSEYECLPLDERFRSMPPGDYQLFLKNLCLQRLRLSGFAVPQDPTHATDWLVDQFASVKPDRLGDEEVVFVNQGSKRPWLDKARKYLTVASRTFSPSMQETDFEEVLALLSCPAHPVVERVNLHALYQSWRKRRPLLQVAREIADQSAAFVEGKSSEQYAQLFQHWRADMIAQICRDCAKPMCYSGLDDIMRLAHGLPRHMLVILKHIYGWSVFRGEQPFAGGHISLEAQRLGIKDACEWFFSDARMAGQDGTRIRTAVSRVAEMLRAIRFSDKPAEVSPSTFSVDLSRVSEETQEVLRLAQEWSLITSIDGGRPDRNSFRIDAKFQLNPLLAPRWDLPIVRRGEVQLQPEAADVVFCGDDNDYRSFLKDRTAAMRGPLFGKSTDETATLPFEGQV